MSDYNRALAEMVHGAQMFAARARLAARAGAGLPNSAETDAAAQAAVAQCRAELLELLNEVPAMRLVYSVTPLRR